MLSWTELIARAHERGASDVHMVCGMPFLCRVDGRVERLTEETLTREQCEQYARELAGAENAALRETGECDLSQTMACGVRVRGNLFRQQGAVSAAVRLLADGIPELESLGLPPAVLEFADYRSGIVLVTGETGSGKSTTLAALLDRINHTRAAHILTLEDPIEYVYTPDRCLINQRQIGSDTRSYASGLRAALREDPDVLLIVELRDLDTIETALTAADSIDRMLSVFPEGRQRQARLQISTTLRAVLSQQLLPRKGGHGRALACEVMVVSPAIRNLIREGKTPQIESFITMNAQGGSIPMDSALQKLVQSGAITQDTARSYARDREHFPGQPRW